MIQGRRERRRRGRRHDGRRPVLEATHLKLSRRLLLSWFNSFFGEAKSYCSRGWRNCWGNASIVHFGLGSGTWRVRATQSTVYFTVHFLCTVHRATAKPGDGCELITDWHFIRYTCFCCRSLLRACCIDAPYAAFVKHTDTGSSITTEANPPWNGDGGRGGGG